MWIKNTNYEIMWEKFRDAIYVSKFLELQIRAKRGNGLNKNNGFVGWGYEYNKRMLIKWPIIRE